MSASRKGSGVRPKSRESRWERLRRKNDVSLLNIKTETVKKFLNVFTDEYLADLVRKDEEKSFLDPVVVMEMRHEAVKKARKETESSPKIREFREEQQEKITSHNKTIEINMIENELSKFRQEMTKKHPPKVKKVKIPENPYCLLDNGEIFTSLSTTEEKTNDFYRKMIEAPIESAKIFDVVKVEQKIPSVQFEDSVEIITYPQEVAEVRDEAVESPLDEETYFGLREERQMISYCEETTTTVKSFFTFHGITSSPSQESESGSSTAHGSTESSTIFNQEDELEASFLEQAIKAASQESESEKNPNEELMIRQLLPGKRSETEADEPKVEGRGEISPEKIKIISELFREHSEAYNDFKEILLRKYFLKWLHYTTVEKVSKCKSISSTDRIGKIDAYLSKIREEKRRVRKKEENAEAEGEKKSVPKEESIILTKKYRSKLKIQQDIIEYQKLKLERQERMIAELRLSKLSEEARSFKQELKNELKQVAKTGDIRVRAKAKCLQIVSNLRDEEDENKLAAYGSVIPPFLAQMQERALERTMRHERAKERRRQLERDREEQKNAQEEEKRREDEEAKRVRMQELKEKRRREKQEKLRREQERQVWLQNCKRANEFYCRHLLHFGLTAFRRMLQRKRRFEAKASHFRRVLRMRICFRRWRGHTKSIWDAKHRKSEAFHGTFVLRQAVRLWKASHLMEKGKLLVAVDWYEMRLNERFFGLWVARTRQEKIVLETKMRHAEAHYNWHLKWRSIEHWQRLHAILRLEKETEARRQRWRHKIWELLPDYAPTLDG
ncbi:golgin subfamily A member 6-like protein 6 [Phlebotomus argentipes]|uniref:golgin subfamily A member 6-like protein 6 n=1 Tax=Phlebotomus argentipes TaxID=94469 RepID=UPI0028932FEB|nr:golgin subfamily A member 6-like protein 6 [Phlebotomus argentipes]XP_059620736.1 golgin subfamily A member 6-like protein 6 [Phlebotomus argentipes]